MTFSPPQMPVSTRLMALVDAGHLHSNAAQKTVAYGLDTVFCALAAHEAEHASFLQYLPGFIRGKSRKSPGVKGLYIWGSVGCGKTMLMDFFYEALRALPAEGLYKKVHFHDFMREIHALLFQERKKRRRKRGEKPTIHGTSQIIRESAQKQFKNLSCLCLDEFVVDDIADAMLLERLFSCIFSWNIPVIATSNVPPEHLYRDGLNRHLFLPFIDLVHRYMDVIHLDAPIDFRRRDLLEEEVYFTPLSPETCAQMDRLWKKVTCTQKEHVDHLTVGRRSIPIPRTAAGAVRFDFQDVCAQPLGAADYLVLSEKFSYFFIDNVPILGKTHRNEAKRFIHLIDVLYAAHKPVILSAQAEPDALYRDKDAPEAFQFARTASRLMEMRGRDYLRYTALEAFF